MALSWSAESHAADRPNILFISIDDLNDWIGCLGGHPHAKTPNIDRLAASGVLFTNVHCPAPACNPSRGAIMTGIPPHVSGLYDNRQKMRERMPDAELMPRYFSRHGYWSAGSGKILHYFIDAPSCHEYYPPKETEDPFPRTKYPKKRPVNLPVGGPWQYVETDWGALDVTDEEFGGDWLVSKWIGKQLNKEHDKPFFLACGIYRPHEPWFVPKKYFEQFPLDALEKGPNSDNAIVVLWSDNGWHLGEKQHWQKFAGWRVCTRVPLIVRVPAGTPGLAQGTAKDNLQRTSEPAKSIIPAQ